MKRSWRWYLVWGTIVASLSMLLFTAMAGPAHAWSQARNPLARQEVGLPGVPGKRQMGMTPTTPACTGKNPITRVSP